MGSGVSRKSAINSFFKSFLFICNFCHIPVISSGDSCFLGLFKETPVFITYQKSDKTKRNAIYQNNLSDGKRLRWYTRSPRHLNSPEVKRLLKTPNMKIHVFIKESDAFGKQFSYLEQAKIDFETVKEEKLGEKKVVGMDLVLEHKLDESKKEEVLGVR